jgi:hypothetical protein
MKISPVGDELFHLGRTDRHDEASNSRFLKFYEKHLKKTRRSPVLLQYWRIVRNNVHGHKGTCFTVYNFFFSEFQLKYTGLFKMIVGVQLSSDNSSPNSGNNHHLTVPFEGGMHSFKRQCVCVSRNWRYESEPPLKPSPLTCGTNPIIVLMFVESQTVHI